jgi:uncharacterized membrane protein
MTVWVGGLFVLSFALLPVVMRDSSSPQDASKLAATAIHRFQRISREIIFLVFLTGIFNFMHAGVARNFEFGATYMEVLAAKFVIFISIIVIQAWMSTRLGPALVATASQIGDAPSKESFRRLQRKALLTSILAIVLGAIAILLGLGLRYT